MADIKLNGTSISTFDGKSYVLYKIIVVNKYKTFVGANDPILVPVFTFDPTDLVFAENRGTNSRKNIGLGWAGFGLIDQSLPNVDPKYYGKVIRSPSIIGGVNQGIDMIWYCYRLIANEDKDTVPPLVNVYNGQGDLAFTSKIPSLVIDRFIEVPDNIIFGRWDNPNNDQPWRSTYNVNTETIMLGNALSYTPKIAVAHAIGPGADRSGNIWLGVYSSLGTAQQTNVLDRIIYQNNIVIGIKPSASEIAKTPVFNGGKDPIIGGSLT